MGKRGKLINRLTSKQIRLFRRELYEAAKSCNNCMPREHGTVRPISNRPVLDVAGEVLQDMGMDFKPEEIPDFLNQLDLACPECGGSWSQHTEVGTSLYEDTIGIGSVREEEEIQTSRVRAVVMFADIRQFSEWVKEGQSPEIVGDFLKKCYLLFRKVLWEHENPFVKLLGDGFFACWEIDRVTKTGPDLAEIGKKTALETAFEIVERYPSIERDLGRPIASGLGIGIGEDFVTRLEIRADNREQFDYVGYTVNLVARIQSIAHAGQVLVHDNVRRKLNSSHYTFRKIAQNDLLDLKGIYESERSRILEVHKNG